MIQECIVGQGWCDASLESRPYETNDSLQSYIQEKEGGQRDNERERDERRRERI